jgi:hypothetical protein
MQRTVANLTLARERGGERLQECGAVTHGNRRGGMQDGVELSVGEGNGGGGGHAMRITVAATRRQDGAGMFSIGTSILRWPRSLFPLRIMRYFTGVTAS